MLTKHDISSTTPEAREVIYAQNLVKKFNGTAVVDDISFSVQKGECFGILGPNGAGKTTTVKMIHALSPLTSGRLEVLGLDVKQKPRKIKQKTGVVSQQNNLDPELTLWENLEVFARYYGLNKVFQDTHLNNLMDLMELHSYANHKVEILSGGLKRRLSIARGLINNPSLLILDEPTTGLDPQARHVVWQQMRRIKEDQITLLLTTHYLEEASQLCDRIVIMDKGKIIDEGSPHHLVSKHVGKEVLELRLTERPELWKEKVNSNLKELIKAAKLLGDMLYLYTNNGKELLKIIQDISPPCTYHNLRNTTLEDVFLKLTGKELSA